MEKKKFEVITTTGKKVATVTAEDFNDAAFEGMEGCFDDLVEIFTEKYGDDDAIFLVENILDNNDEESVKLWNDCYDQGLLDAWATAVVKFLGMPGKVYRDNKLIVW